MARKKKPEEPENLERWMVSYADFITLLFAFFTVMYALSLTDQNKYKQAIENIQRAFLSAGGIFPLRGSPFVPFERPADRGSAVPPSVDDNQGRYSKEKLSSMEKIKTQLRGLYSRTTGLELANDSVDILPTEKGYQIRLGEYVLFNPGSDKLKRENLPFLYEMGKRLVELNSSIQVEGHSDISPGRTPEENWRLSIDRAFNVAQFLLVGVGFKKELLSISGFGDTRPIADNNTPEGRSKNRRVEVSVVAPDRNIAQHNW